MKSILEKVVKNIQKEISVDIKYLNQGGCGWFAYFMVSNLKAMGFDAKIKLITRGKNSIWYSLEDDIIFKKNLLNTYMNEGRENCDENQLEYLSFSHCFVSVNGLNFDGEVLNKVRLRSEYRGYKFEGEYTLEELEIALKEGGWNNTYKKEKYNQRLQNIIERNLNQLKQKRLELQN